MGETQPGPALVSYRDGVTELIDAGEPVGVVEGAIDTSAGLTEDANGVLDLRFGRAAPTRTRPLGRPGLTGDDMAPRERDAEEASLKERGGAGRDLRQRDLRRGTRAAADRPRPLEFDARGIPIAQPIPSFVRPVARLLGEEHTK